MKLPAVIAVQSGLNVPRYASLIAIRKAAKKEITTVGGDSISGDDLRADIGIERLFTPPVTKMAEILTGDPEEVSEKISSIIKEKGLI
jgi:electron transfer flavoprotein beta subunit